MGSNLRFPARRTIRDRSAALRRSSSSRFSRAQTCSAVRETSPSCRARRKASSDLFHTRRQVRFLCQAVQDLLDLAVQHGAVQHSGLGQLRADQMRAAALGALRQPVAANERYCWFGLACFKAGSKQFCTKMICTSRCYHQARPALCVIAVFCSLPYFRLRSGPKRRRRDADVPGIAAALDGIHAVLPARRSLLHRLR